MLLRTLAMRVGVAVMGVVMVVIACLAVLVVMMIVRVIVPVVSMIVVAMVVTVTVTMAMAVIMIMVMIVAMMRVVVMAVLVCMSGGDGVGAAFGIEWRLDLDHAAAEAAHHLLDHMIAADAQPLCHHLHRQVAVAEVPGDAHEMQVVAAADFQQRLRGCHHLDQPPVVQHQRVAAAQRDHLGQVEQELQPARTGHRHAPAMAVVELEHDGVSRLAVPARSGLDGGGAQHQRLITSAGLMISITVGEALNGADSSRHTFMCGALPCASRCSRDSQRSITT